MTFNDEFPMFALSTGISGVSLAIETGHQVDQYPFPVRIKHHSNPSCYTNSSLSETVIESDWLRYPWSEIGVIKGFGVGYK